LTCGVVAGKTTETAQQVTGTAAEKAEQGTEKLAQAAQKGKDEVVSTFVTTSLYPVLAGQI